MFEWDHFSDQPYPIRDKKAKKEIYEKTIFDTLKLLFVNILLFPFILIRFFISLFETKQTNRENFFGMGISLGTDKKLVDELGIEELLIRLPLSDIENLDKYKTFIEQFKEYNILVNILQDRRHVENKEKLKESITAIFKTLPIKQYQIGNAINRKKWAFFTMDEYMKFYKTVQDIRDEEFQDIKLIGSSVIDFEYHFSVRTLFNFYKIHYDKFSTLLYVDRRGSPENSQMGLDLVKKIKLLYAMVTLSPKSSNDIVITETNWPITGTAPYAPTSEKECVSLEDYSLYMVLYYLLALSTGMIEKVYWHQLVATGYGLVDERDKNKYLAFEAFKVMIALLKDAKLVEFDFKDEIKYMKFEKDKTIEIYWSKDRAIKKQGLGKLLNIYGRDYKGENFLYSIRES
jgi:hypothetical protein